MINPFFFAIIFALSGPGGEAEPNGAEPGAEIAKPTLRAHMVVTAQFRPESARETPIEVIVLDEEDMAGKHDLRELLAAELQMDLQQHSVFGSSLSMGGVSHENVKILINGMPVLGRLNGIIDLEQLGLSAFERVEIIRGPGSVYYGTDALGGVVNLIPKRATDAPEIDLQTDYRDIGDERQVVKAALPLGRHGFNLTLARRHFDGEDETPLTRIREWAERKQENASLSWRRDYDSFSLTAFSTFSEEALTDLGEFSEGVAWDQHYETRRTSYQCSVDGVWGKRINYNLLAGYADYDRTRTSFQSFEVPSQEPGETNVDPAFDNAFDMSMLKGMISMSDLMPNVDAQLGMEWALEEGSGGRILNGSQEMEDIAVFGGLRWHYGGWVIQPMARAMENDVYDAPTIPSLHLKYSGLGGLVWRGSYSKGFRAPSIKESYLDFSITAGPFRYHITGNADLKAERGHHYDTSVSLPLWSGDRSLIHLNSHLFFNDIDNMIALSTLTPDGITPNLFRRRYINVDEHRSRGGDLSVKGTLKETSFELAITRTETYNALSGSHSLPQYNGRWDGRLKVDHEFYNHRFSLLIKQVGEQPGFLEVSTGRGRPTVIEEVTVAAYDRIDLFWRYKRSGSGLYMGAGVKNLADVQNQDTVALSDGTAHAVNHMDWGRSYQIELGWRLLGNKK